MRHRILGGESVELIALAASSSFTLGCGISTGGKNSDPPTNTYMYVAEGESAAYVAQLQVGSDGTLTPLNPATVGSPGFPGIDFVTVDPSGQYLFTGSALLGGTTPANQYLIGSDGTLTPNVIPSVNVTGWNQFTFTPNGGFTFVPDFEDGVIDTYSLSSSGALAQVSQLAVSAIASNIQPTAIDPTGHFLYVSEVIQIGYTNSFFDELMEYSISPDGVLTPLTPNFVEGPGYTYSLKVAPNGFLYFLDHDHGVITVFQIDESTGQLANAGSFATGTGPESAPLSIAFDPTSAYAYVLNSADDSVTQFTVNASTGGLTMNGPDVPTGLEPACVAVDPSGTFAFVTNYDGTISQFVVSSGGRLTPNGTFSLSAQTSAAAMAFAQR